MQNGSYKIKLNKNQLNTLYFTVNNEAIRQNKYKTMQMKLVLVNILSIAHKLNAKSFMPGSITRITFSASEALAFWLAFNDQEFGNDFTMVLMRNLLDDIHKKFI